MTRKEKDKSVELRSQAIPIVVDDISGLRNIAAISARCANDMLTARYVNAKAFSKAVYNLSDEERKAMTAEDKKAIAASTKSALTPYVDYKDELSGNVRDALTKEVEAIWQKIAKSCLAGHRTLALFDSDRSLRVRDRGVSVVRDGDGFAIEFQLLPRGADWHRFQVEPLPLRKDMYMADLLGALADHPDRLRKGTIKFLRNNRGIMAILCYEKKIEPDKGSGSIDAKIGPVGPDGEIYIRMAGAGWNYEDRRRLKNMTAIVQMMASRKANIAGLWSRLRKSGKKRAMAKAQRFEDWADTPCHQLSAAIVSFCASHKVGRLEWLIKNAHEVSTTGPGGAQVAVTLPWARLKSQVTYKGREHGFEVVEEQALLTGKKLAEGDIKWLRQTNKAVRLLGQAVRKG